MMKLQAEQATGHDGTAADVGDHRADAAAPAVRRADLVGVLWVPWHPSKTIK